MNIGNPQRIISVVEIKMRPLLDKIRVPFKVLQFWTELRTVSEKNESEHSRSHQVGNIGGFLSAFGLSVPLLLLSKYLSTNNVKKFQVCLSSGIKYIRSLGIAR